jgi:YggT family protein
MRALLDVVLLVLQLYWYIVLAMIIMSWLIAFNVVNTRNQFVSQVWRVLESLTDPVLRPIRRRMPNFSGLDLSPLILFIAIYFVQQIILRYVYPNVF